MVYDYRAPHEFLRDLLTHYKATSNFSVRQRAPLVNGCSPALVTQVLKGRRRLTRDQLPAFAKMFKLHGFEYDFIDQSLKPQQTETETPAPRPQRTPKNHLLSHWLNMYVKDLVHLAGFKPEANFLSRMLYGIAPERAIERSIQFLLREGFWRKNLNGDTLTEESVVTSTNEIPNQKIRELHKRALKIALRGIDTFPTDRRKAATILMSLNREQVAEMRDMIDGFQNQLLRFIEQHPQGRDELIQITMHLTPVGGRHD